MARLLDPFFALFSLGLAIKAADPEAAHLASRTQAQDEARTLLNAAGISSGDVEVASFAVVA